MKIHLYASHLADDWRNCLGSIHGKLDYVVHLADQCNWNWGRKIDYQHKVACEDPEELLMFVDLWDMIFVGDPEELEAQIAALPRAMVPSGTKCWPEEEKTPLFAERYPEITSPWRFVNGAGTIGRGDHIREAIEFGLSRYPVRPPVPGTPLHDHKINDNDQRFWTDVYLDGRVDNDHQCMFVQQIIGLEPGQAQYNDKRLVNTVTGTRPQFIHASGHSWEHIPAELIKDHCTYEF